MPSSRSFRRCAESGGKGSPHIAHLSRRKWSRTCARSDRSERCCCSHCRRQCTILRRRIKFAIAGLDQAVGRRQFRNRTGVDGLHAATGGCLINSSCACAWAIWQSAIEIPERGRTICCYCRPLLKGERSRKTRRRWRCCRFLRCCYIGLPDTVEIAGRAKEQSPGGWVAGIKRVERGKVPGVIHAGEDLRTTDDAKCGLQVIVRGLHYMFGPPWIDPL